MKLYIAPVNAAVFLISCVVAYFVYRHDTRSAGDVPAAVAVAAAVVLLLSFLLRGEPPAETGSGDHQPAPTASVSAQP
ncbi:hypothetical protein [Streptomyces microflavus]|uniref:hypothetical protein n=1 Tax=Streptomyces microflavus TaxID=1919 RepID=UPI003410F2A9